MPKPPKAGNPSLPLTVPYVVTQVCELLARLDPDDQQKAIDATLVIIGRGPAAASTHTPPNASQASLQSRSLGTGKVAARDFFHTKQPKNKVEQLAVAARFRETELGETANGRDELHEVFKAARVNFDTRNYRRDMDNAKKQSFFNKGSENELSYYGQNFVDALPDRAKAEALPKPRKATRRSPMKKKAKS